jgi:putative Mn2+ efflux pump MntP
MPFLGSLLGSLIAGFISKYASVVMFLIFGALGVKMLWDGFRCAAQEGECCRNFGIGLVFVQALPPASTLLPSAWVWQPHGTQTCSTSP